MDVNSRAEPAGTMSPRPAPSAVHVSKPVTTSVARTTISASADQAAAARRRGLDWRGYGAAVAGAAAATGLGWLLFHGPRLPDVSRQPHLADANVLMFYL